MTATDVLLLFYALPAALGAALLTWGFFSDQSNEITWDGKAWVNALLMAFTPILNTMFVLMIVTYEINDIIDRRKRKTK